MITESISKLIEEKNLNQKEAQAAMAEIMSGKATPSQIAGFLVALRSKGETIDEIAGCALAMRDAARPLTLHPKLIVDNCGTGGDGRNGLNVSTAAAFVLAGAGLTVAKHGNRAISSKCGSADVLEALGVRVDPPPAIVEQCINEVGIGFMFAPAFHPAMKFAMPTRKELGIRTVFNILGPLTNPARTKVQLIGVFRPEMTKMMADVLKKMGHLAGLVVHSGGWDEITLHEPTQVTEVVKGKIRSYRLTNKDFGLPKVLPKHLVGGDPAHNGRILTDILENRDHPAKHVVIANAAALLWIAERSSGRKNFTLNEAVEKSQKSLSSGAALQKCRLLASVSHSIE